MKRVIPKDIGLDTPLPRLDGNLTALDADSSCDFPRVSNKVVTGQT
jgi:hypothetical protein